MLKNKELLLPTSCLNKAANTEPVFVLRANDIIAPMTIRHWVTMSEGHHDPDKLQEALDMADDMETWQKENLTMTAK